MTWRIVTRCFARYHAAEDVMTLHAAGFNARQSHCTVYVYGTAADARRAAELV